ncbi:MAG: SCO family protein [Oligoflexales bacterium]
MLRVLSVATTISVFIAGFLFFQNSHQGKQATKIEPIASFSLTNHLGEAFDSKELKGQLWVTHFMFTTCQGPCPLMTKKITSLHQELESTSPFHLVSMTMNPEQDDETALQEYASRFGGDTNWSLVYGPIEDIISIARQVFRVPADKDPNLHSTLFVLIDHEQKIRGYYDSQDPERMNKLKQDIQEISLEKEVSSLS